MTLRMDGRPMSPSDTTEPTLDEFEGSLPPYLESGMGWRFLRRFLAVALMVFVGQWVTDGDQFKYAIFVVAMVTFAGLHLPWSIRDYERDLWYARQAAYRRWKRTEARQARRRKAFWGCYPR